MIRGSSDPRIHCSDCSSNRRCGIHAHLYVEDAAERLNMLRRERLALLNDAAMLSAKIDRIDGQIEQVEASQSYFRRTAQEHKDGIRKAT